MFPHHFTKGNNLCDNLLRIKRSTNGIHILNENFRCLMKLIFYFNRSPLSTEMKISFLGLRPLELFRIASCNTQNRNLANASY